MSLAHITVYRKYTKFQPLMEVCPALPSRSERKTRLLDNQVGGQALRLQLQSDRRIGCRSKITLGKNLGRDRRTE